MTFSVNAAMPGSYDHLQVALSVVIAIAASYAALDLAGRVTAASGSARSVWLAGGAMGVGIWSMHFTGMLAFHVPIPVGYDWPTVLMSLLAAILSSVFALYVASRQKMGWVQALTSSIALGAGIAGVHYIGMAAMHLGGSCRFNLLLVTLSVVLAIVFSAAALLLAFDLREETKGTPSRKIASACVMGAAISGMHYSGMASASFIPSAANPDLSHTVNVSVLSSAGIVTVTLIILGAAVRTSAVSRRFAAQALESRALSDELEHRVIERTRQLTTVDKQLAQSEERFRKLVEALPDAILVHSKDRIVFINPFGMRLLGAQRPEQLVGKDISEIIHPHSLASVRRRISECYRTGTASSPMDNVLVSLDGSSVDIEALAIPIVWEGAPAIEVVIRDNQERKRAEEELRQSRTRTESILESVGDIHILFDRGWHYLYVNRAAASAVDREQILGRTLWELYPDIIGTELDRHYRRAMEERIPVAFDFYYHTTDTWWENRFYPAPEGLSVFATNITERKRAEQALLEAQADLAHVTRALAMGELVATIAHEVNQPLTAIVTYAGYCLRQLASDAPDLRELREAIGEIANDGNRASAVISRIRVLLMKGTPDRVKLDINEVIHEVTSLMRNEVTRNHISLRTDLTPDLPSILGDRVQLQQVLINLIINSIDAMGTVTDRPRELRIESGKNPDGVLIQVQDSGRGFDSEQADHIFEPFFTTKPQGIGMGLSISLSIIESHGGRLWAESGSKGALFQFTLPTQD